MQIFIEIIILIDPEEFLNTSLAFLFQPVALIITFCPSTLIVPPS